MNNKTVKISPDQKSGENHFSLAVPIFLSLLSLVVVIASVIFVHGWENERLQKNFDFSTTTYRQLFKSRLQNIIIELEAGKGFFLGSKFVDRQEFSRFTQSQIRNSNEFRAMIWVPKILDSQRSTIESAPWVKGLNGRKIHDLNPSDPPFDYTLSPARKIHFPILYAEPEQRMKEQISFDLASIPELLSLLERARDEGTIVPISGIASPHFLLNANKKTKSQVSFVQPIYKSLVPLQTIKQRRDKHLGFIILQYDIGLALESILATLKSRGLDIYIVDVKAKDGQEIIYYHRSRIGGHHPPLSYSELLEPKTFIHKSSLDIFGRQWKIIIVPALQYFSVNKQYQSTGVFIFGIILSALFSYVLFTNQLRTNVIQQTVRSKTKELEISNNALQHEATKRKKQLRELEFHKFAIDEHAIVSITDENGIITYANDKFCQISGYSREELMGQKHNIVFSGEHSPKFFEKMWKTISNGKVWHADIKNQKKNRAFYWVRTTIVPNVGDDGKPFQYVSIRTDITKSKILEMDLRHSKQDAEKSNKAKSEFLSSMSHELRTPMNAILGFSQMLEYNPKEPLSPAQTECVELITKGGNHLLTLINDILDLAKIESGKVEMVFEDISPIELFHDCLPLVSELSTKLGIKIIIPCEYEDYPKVRADHMRLKQILLNLLSNAIKYNQENGTVTIRVEPCKNKNIHIYVTDTGVGLTEADQNKLFKPFSRISAERTDIEGTGIGLVVCQNLITLMNGTISVNSELGKGTEICLELPQASTQVTKKVETVQ